MLALTHLTLYTGDEVLHHKAVLIKNQVIEDIVDENAVPEGCELIDLKGQNVAPGFIDLQINGCGGSLFNNDISVDTLEIMHRTNLRFGTTSFLPTLITCSDDDIKKAVLTTQAAQRTLPSILGLHLEGPYINPFRNGVHDKTKVRRPGPDMVKFICDYGGQVIKMMTSAPEIVSPETIGRIKDRGIINAAGHSNATYSEAENGFKSGFVMATHLFNAMPEIRARESGLVGAVLDRPHVFASIIADGYHVSYPNIRMVKKVKKEKLCLVTDAMPPVGTEMSCFFIGDQKIEHKDGKCLSGQGTLSGSGLSMDVAVRNCVRFADIPLDEALRMASTYPAKILNMETSIGRVQKGYRADLVIFNADVRVTGVVVQGELSTRTASSLN